LLGIPFAEGESADFPFGEDDFVGISFGEPRQTHFQQIHPRQTHFQQNWASPSAIPAGDPRQTRFQQIRSLTLRPGDSLLRDLPHARKNESFQRLEASFMIGLGTLK
jgi:hypothetical protein